MVCGVRSQHQNSATKPWTCNNSNMEVLQILILHSTGWVCLLPVVHWATSHKKKCSNHWFGSNIQILISRIMLNFSFGRLGGHYFGVRWHRYPISRSVLVVDVLGCLQFAYELLSPRIGEEPSISILSTFPWISSFILVSSSQEEFQYEQSPTHVLVLMPELRLPESQHHTLDPE